MTRAELEQLKSLKQEAKQLQEELKNLPFVPASVKGSMSEFPYIETTFKVFGVDEQKGKQVRNKLDAILENLQSEILRMENWLETLPDSEIRAIMRMKYWNGMKDNEIAAEIGYSRSAVSMKVKRFFDDMKV